MMHWFVAFILTVAIFTAIWMPEVLIAYLIWNVPIITGWQIFAVIFCVVWCIVAFYLTYILLKIAV